MNLKKAIRLAKYAGNWRVDGFGEVSNFEGKIPQITVCFSGVNPSEKFKAHQNAALTGEHRVLSYPISALNRFQIGSVWNEGARISTAENQSDLFTIDVDQIKYVRLNEEIELNSVSLKSIIPPQYFKFGGSLKYLENTFYAVAPVIGNKRIQWMIIPCSELYNMYLGVSSRFANSLPKDRLEKYVDWEQCNRSVIQPILKVKERLSRVEAFVLLRALATNEGINCLTTPHRHLAWANTENRVQNSDHHLPLVLKAIFPFKGLTNLRVAGKKMPFENNIEGIDPEWGIFAMNILHCSHEAGFVDPIIQSDIDFSPTNVKPGGTTGPTWVAEEEMNDDDDDWENDLPADATIRRIGIYNPTNKFAAMDELKATYIHPFGESICSFNSDDVKDQAGVTYEEGNYEKDSEGNVGLSEFDSHTDSINRELSSFIDMVISLRALTVKRCWVVRTRKIYGSLSVAGEIVTTFPSSSDKRRKWHKIELESGKYRPRQIAFVEIEFEAGKFFYMTEMELKPTEKGRSTLLMEFGEHEVMEDRHFENFLKLTAIKNSWPSKGHKWKTDKETKVAEQLFSNLLIYRMIHIPSSVKDEASGEDGNSADRWAKSTLDRIDIDIGFNA